jgi:DeoR/GlpR family transcriptional regulator of sugar metabolism
VLELLDTRESVQVSELSEAFAVSEVTVRQDLAHLAEQGLVARVRGGVRALPRAQSELAFDARLRLQAEQKRAMARLAFSLVADGESVALDSSTSAYYLALELRRRRELVVVTNGLLIAAALADAPGVTVLLTGGMLRQAAMSVVGDLAAQVLHSTRIDKGFFGARGLSLERGLLDLNPDEVRFKQQMVAACERVIGLFDGTKWQRSALLSFVPAERVDAIVTDATAPGELVERWRERGVEVYTAQAAAAAPRVERIPGLLRDRDDVGAAS